MKILLINANPVVSRLLALCTRDRDLELDEVSSVDEIGESTYDLLFVDDGSYVDAVDRLLVGDRIRKKIFISYVEEDAEGFDASIQKPFLPSQIIKVIESVEALESFDTSEEKHFIFPLAQEDIVEKCSEEEIEIVDTREERFEELLELPDTEDLHIEKDAFLKVLDGNEIEKIKALLEMDDEENIEVEKMSEEEVHLRKVEVIKEQLISEGLEILDEDEIVDVLSAKTKEKVLKCKKTKVKYKKENKRKREILACSKEELHSIEEAMTRALLDLGSKGMKKFLKGKKVKFTLKIEDNH